MIKRVVEIGHEASAHLSHSNLVVEREGGSVSIPIEDIGLLLIDEARVTLSAALLVACAELNVAVVACDRRHLPAALSLPIAGNSLHAAVLRTQVGTSAPTRKRAWQVIVRAKIRNQASVLDVCERDGSGLRAMAARVRSGDPSNVEATAARRYWTSLFGPQFRRDPQLDGANSLLNYGYAVVRAGVARAVVSAGLHPALGLHHRNQGNPFALADDLVEPLRPAVDRTVYGLVATGETELDRCAKEALLGVLDAPIHLGDERMSAWTALPRYASSLLRLLEGAGATLEVPFL